MFEMTVTATPDQADLCELEDAVLEFNRRRTGYRDGRILACVPGETFFSKRLDGAS